MEDRDLIQWPAYKTKSEFVQDLEAAIGGGAAALSDAIRRFTHTDVSAWPEAKVAKKPKERKPS